MLAVTIPIQAAGGPALVNQQSLQSANDFLRVASATIAPGEFLDRAPTDIVKDAGIPNPLAVARAVRALSARRRLDMVDARHRLRDRSPAAPGLPPRQPTTRWRRCSGS